MNTHTEHHEHDTVNPLLPWYAAGQLSPAEQALVAAHLRTCAACRAELAWQRQLHAAAAVDEADVPLPDMEAALARLLPQLDERPANVAAGPGPLAAFIAWLRRGPALPAAFALVLVALSATLPSIQSPGYVGLGPVPASSGDTTVVFRPDTRPADVRRILAASGATAVHGPTVAGAYVLKLGPAQRGEALARLRREPAVLMAEPLDSGAPP